MFEMLQLPQHPRFQNKFIAFDQYEEPLKAL
jgi:hypothetical protein